MTFRFANVEGRSALVDSEGRWFDASNRAVASSGAIPWRHGSSSTIFITRPVHWPPRNRTGM